MVKESKILELVKDADGFGIADLQKEFSLGFSEAVELLDRMEVQGVIEKDGTKKPTIYRVKGIEIIAKIEKYKGKVLPICGRPGIGQESISLQMALNYYKFTSKAVIIFSPHQTKREIQMRLVSIRDGYNYYWAKSKTSPTRTVERFNGYVRGMDFSQPNVDDNENITEEYFVSQIENTEDIGMVVMLDYDFYSDKLSVDLLKKIAEQMRIPIIVDCLVNREVEDREDCHPRREDMKSAELSKMDTVLLVYRESYYDLDSTDTTTELIIDEGETKKAVMLRYVVSRLKFYDMK